MSIDQIVQLQTELIIHGTMPIMTIDSEGLIAPGMIWISDEMRQAYERAELMKGEIAFAIRKAEEAYYFHLELCDLCSNELCGTAIMLRREVRKLQQ